MPGDASVIASKLANALLAEARPVAAASLVSGGVLERFREQHGGLWVGGRVTLTPDALTFEPNALNRAVHTGLAAQRIPLAGVASVADRFGWVTRIIDVRQDDGSLFTFRCFGAPAFARQIEAARMKRRGRG